MRGLANPIRLLLAHADVRYEDKRYSLKDEAGMNEWIKEDKVQLKGTLDFPNLPYYIDGMVQMTQVNELLSRSMDKVNTILLFLCRAEPSCNTLERSMDWLETLIRSLSEFSF